MNTSLYTFLLVCFLLLGGCGHAGQSPEDFTREEELPEVTQIPEDLVREKEPPEMIKIQNLTLTDKTLTLDYRVSNPFEEDIWVCHDTWVYGKENVQNVIERIVGETAWIKLSFNVETKGMYSADPQAIAKYVRLRPGESYSGKILRDLPIGDYFRVPGERPKEHKQIVLHRAVFEIGYIGAFGPEWDKILASWAEKFEREQIKPKPKVSGPLYYLPVNPLITEETLDGQLREVMYLQEHTGLEKREESAEILIVDVNIPCSVVADDK